MSNEVLSRQFSSPYDTGLLAIAIVLAVCCCYIVFEMTPRVVAATGRLRSFWLAFDSLALGAGVRAVQGAAALAFHLPVMVAHKLPVGILSITAAVASAAFALSSNAQRTFNLVRFVIGSFVLGGGWVLMHYAGLWGVGLAAYAGYHPLSLSFSMVTALPTAALLLWLVLRFVDDSQTAGWQRISAAVAMGFLLAAICYVSLVALTREHRPAGFSSELSALQIIAVLATSLLTAAAGRAAAAIDRSYSSQRAELQSERQRWDLVMKASQEGLFDLDLTSGTAFHSPKWMAILGYEADDLPGITKTWYLLVHPDDRARVERTYEEHLSSRRDMLDIEYRLRHRDGSWRWIRARAQAVWDESGYPSRLVGSHADINAQKRAEAEFKASEMRLKTFMDNNPAVTYIKGFDGRITFTNQMLNRQWNLQPGGWNGKLADQIWPSSVAAGIRSADLAVFRSGAPQEAVERLPMPDGTFRHFVSNRFLIADASGQPALGAVLLDITERLDSEAAIRKSEARYRELFQDNPLTSWIYDKRDLAIRDVNAAAVAQFGWTREEFLELTLNAVCMQDEAQAIEAILKEKASRHEPSPPQRFWRKDGSIVWVELISHDLNTADFPARLVIINDVTARVEGEKNIRSRYDSLKDLVSKSSLELAEKEAEWRALVQATPQVVWAAKIDGSTDFLSEQLFRYTGIPVAELYGTNWLRVVHPADRDNVTAHWATAIETGEPSSFDLRLLSREGKYRWFTSRAVALRDTHGQITRWIGIFTDIENLKRSQELSDRAAAEKARELAQERDRAQSAAAAKSQFLAAMSHEIRTPMNGLIGMTALLLDTELDSEQRCFADTLRSSGEALMTVINDVLDFSKIEIGKLELETTEFDLQTVVEEAFELVSTPATEKQLVLSFEISRDVPLDLLGDPGRLKQVLLHVLSNSVKYTSRGTVQLSVSRQAHNDLLTVLQFAIRDTGSGFTPEQQKLLLQPAAGGGKAVAEESTTDLGLVMSKRIIEMMGGSLGFSSSVGGSTSWFNAVVQTSKQSNGFDVLAGKTLGLPDGSLRPTWLPYIERTGIRVIENFDTSSQEGAEVLLLDAQSRSALADLESIRSRPDLAGLPVIVLGNAKDLTGGSARKLENVLYVPKPIRRLSLLRAIRSVLVCDVIRPAKPSPAKSGGAPRILIAEDNKLHQTIVRSLLEKLGYRADLVENGLEACAFVLENNYDLVLMDCQMPGLDGFEATQQIRQMQSDRGRVPIVALTASVQKEERDRCYAAGMDDFLSKPIDRQKLVETLEKWLPVMPESIPQLPGLFRSSS